MTEGGRGAHLDNVVKAASVDDSADHHVNPPDGALWAEAPAGTLGQVDDSAVDEVRLALEQHGALSVEVPFFNRKVSNEFPHPLLERKHLFLDVIQLALPTRGTISARGLQADKQKRRAEARRDADGMQDWWLQGSGFGMQGFDLNMPKMPDARVGVVRGIILIQAETHRDGDVDRGRLDIARQISARFELKCAFLEEHEKLRVDQRHLAAILRTREELFRREL